MPVASPLLARDRRAIPTTSAAKIKLAGDT
jgi:hypothetical protein